MAAIEGGSIPSNINLDHGLDANKPASPKEGDMYIATDTGKVYVCYEDGSWIELKSVVETLENVTASRANNTIYQNTTGKPLFVNVIIAATTTGCGYLYVGDDNPPNILISDFWMYGNGYYATLSGLVLPNQYYKITLSYCNLSTWLEWS